MASIDHLATEIYVFVDDWMKRHPHTAAWRTSNNDQPPLTDAEVITIALMQPALGLDTFKATYSIVRDNIGAAFPKLCCYQQWLKRLHWLTALVGYLIKAAAFRAMTPWSSRLYVFDSKPLPLCHALRHGRVLLLREDGAYFGKTAKGWFFGFKLHLVIHQETGTIISAILTPGNWDDRNVALALAWSVEGGIVLCDWGYSGEETFELLYTEADLVRVMPCDAGQGRNLISALRQRIETTLSSLWRKFVDRVFSRSWNGLWNSVKLKLLYFNMRCAGLVSA